MTQAHSTSHLLSLFFRGLEPKKEQDEESFFEITSRKGLPDEYVYNYYFNFLNKANCCIKIISPKKAKDYESNVRRNYFFKVENLVENKRKENGTFSYKRIIPLSKTSPSSDIYTKEVDKALELHIRNITNKYETTHEIGCRSVNELLIPINCMIVDDEYLLLLVPQLCMNKEQIEKDNNCSLIIKIKDTDKTNIKIIENQFNLLYHQGKYINILNKKHINSANIPTIIPQHKNCKLNRGLSQR